MTSDQPLAGIRVLDFTWVLAGPLGTRQLASFGAEVYKVESSGRIDPVRQWPTPTPPAGQGPDFGAWFNDINAGKRSIGLDLSTAEGRALARRLARACNVVVNNFRPGVTERLGLGYRDLAAENPATIVVNLPGCAAGPWAARPSLGPQVAAAAGINTITGFPGTAPSGLGIAYPDFVSPALLVLCVCAAVVERRRTGRGREITIDQLQAAVSLIGCEWLEYHDTRREPPRRANRDPNHCPHGVYPARGHDRWIAIAVGSDAEWTALCAALGRADLARDPRFASHRSRKQNEDAVDDLVTSWTASRDAWTLAEELQAAGVAAAAVADIRDLVERDPCLSHHWQRVRQPAAPEMEITIHGEPVRYAGRQQRLSRAPALCEHTDQALRDLLHLEDGEIAALRARGVIE